MALPAGLASQALQVRFPIRDLRFAKFSPTCIVPCRRRMPHVFGHSSKSNWSARQDLHLRSLGPKPSVLLLHHALLPRRMDGAEDLVLVEMATAFLGTHTPSEIWRTRRELHPQPSRRQRGALLIELRVRNGWPSRSSEPEAASFAPIRLTSAHRE
jgi:hypothetical protein